MFTVCVFMTVTLALTSALTDEFIQHINSNQTLWTAGRNFHKNTPLSYFKRLTGSLPDTGSYYLPQKIYRKKVTKVPRQFDARNKWPWCPTLNQIRDQGACASCWAIAAASAMSDRICITSKGHRNFYFSEDDILSCCKNCGRGCNGGILSRAWKFTQRVGSVSGGSYNSSQGCKPYEIAPCEHMPNFGQHCGIAKTPICRKTCEINYVKSYYKDKKRIKAVYILRKIKDIKKEIMKYGPVTSTFQVFEDFFTYKSGIYKHVSGKFVGFHSVKLIGWGIENNVPYWLAANSWNTNWGDYNGFFKVILGQNHCKIENFVSAGSIL